MADAKRPDLDDRDEDEDLEAAVTRDLQAAFVEDLAGRLLATYHRWLATNVGKVDSPYQVSLALGLFAADALGCLAAGSRMAGGLDAWLDEWMDDLRRDVPKALRRYHADLAARRRRAKGG